MSSVRQDERRSKRAGRFVTWPRTFFVQGECSNRTQPPGNFQSVPFHQIRIGQDLFHGTIGLKLATIQNQHPWTEFLREIQIVRGDDLGSGKSPQDF